MKRKFVEVIVTIIAIAGIVSFFLWQNYQRDINSLVDYEEPAIARPVKLINIESLYTKSCELSKVIDGDTLTATCDRTSLKIRLCGIDAPEMSQQFGKEAMAKLESLVKTDGDKILVSAIELDKYGRTIAEVEVVTGQRTDRGEMVNLFVNGEMARTGLAYEYKQYSSNCPNREAIANAEDEAKSKKLNVWSGNYEKPWDYRRSKK